MSALAFAYGTWGGESASWEAELPARLRCTWGFAQTLGAPMAVHATAGPGATAYKAGDADQADVQAAQGGDGDAFGRLVRRHQQAIGAELDKLSEQISAVLNESQREHWQRTFESLRGTWLPAPPPDPRYGAVHSPQGVVWDCSVPSAS